MMRVDGVTFEFLIRATKLADTYESVVGAVEQDSERMVLEVPCPGDRPYVIVGHRQEWGGFSGRHEGEPGDIEVKAAWNLVGDRWLGTWREEGYQYVFVLTLPAPATEAH